MGNASSSPHSTNQQLEYKSQLIQYAAFYFHRLSSLKPKVYAQAEEKFPKNATFITNILDIR